MLKYKGIQVCDIGAVRKKGFQIALLERRRSHEGNVHDINYSRLRFKITQALICTGA